MKPLDTNYLSLQFKDRIYSKNGTEFQSFFENIMEKAFSDFQKIRPYGNQGDGGNDGYRKNAGIYYQVYSPNTPKIFVPNGIYFGSIPTYMEFFYMFFSNVKMKTFPHIFFRGTQLPTRTIVSRSLSRPIQKSPYGMQTMK